MKMIRARRFGMACRLPDCRCSPLRACAQLLVSAVSRSWPSWRCPRLAPLGRRVSRRGAERLGPCQAHLRRCCTLWFSPVYLSCWSDGGASGASPTPPRLPRRPEHGGSYGGAARSVSAAPAANHNADTRRSGVSHRTDVPACPAWCGRAGRRGPSRALARGQARVAAINADWQHP